ncbi:xylose repressor [Lactococcus piscium]|uniref:Xylose repressor n=1 Tax=Pseudolactococcus piscium TaxID=1364 RepID=A0A2A5S5W0_9LACT|nr:ROK family protein [Lactococcus piscium]PCS08889.1 xylose repressor [Lactococcus piscium]
MKTDQFKVREQNVSIVLQEIIKSNGISRIQLSKITGLNKTSITAITANLLDRKIIFEKGTGEGGISGGRKPIMIYFNEKAGTSLLLDIDAGYLKFTASYLNQQIISQSKQTDVNTTKDNVIETITQLIDQNINKLPETDLGVIGLTIAIHGSVDHKKITFTPRSNIDQIDLFHILQDKYDFDIHIENEAILSTFGEYSFTSHSNYLINFSLGNGIRAGIIQNGVLEKGRSGNAGEVGHTIIKKDGLRCICGNSGCLEQYTSLSAIYRQFSQIKNMNFVNMIIIREYFRNDDPETLDFIKEIVDMLSISINTLVMMFDPEIITLNGDLFKELPEISEMIKTNLKSTFAKKLILRNSFLHDRAAIFGALALNVQHYFDIPNLKYNRDYIQEVQASNTY